jgi:glucan phosphoethanolaminetransferase (alkaline phosphatase superfamily)
MKTLLLTLLKNNTGVSIKNLVAFWGVCMGSLIIFTIVWVIIYDTVKGQSIDFYGIAVLLGAVAAFVISATTLKIYGEKYENRKDYAQNSINYDVSGTGGM